MTGKQQVREWNVYSHENIPLLKGIALNKEGNGVGHSITMNKGEVRFSPDCYSAGPPVLQGEERVRRNLY